MPHERPGLAVRHGDALTLSRSCQPPRDERRAHSWADREDEDQDDENWNVPRSCRHPGTAHVTDDRKRKSQLRAGGGITNCRATTREAVPQADRSTGAELIQNAKAEPTGYFSVAHPPRLASQGTSPRVTGSPRWQRRVPPDPRGPIALVEPERWRSHPAVIRFRE
jgi:hypothetical protein